MRKCIPDHACHDGDRNVPGMIERRVPPEAPGEVGFRRDPQGQSGDSRRKGVARDRQNGKRDRHRPEGRKAEDDERGEGHGRDRHDDDGSLRRGQIDRRADRRLQRNAEQPACCRDEADLGLAPVALRHKIDIDEGAERVAGVGGKEIERVERIRDRDHRHRPKNGSTSSPLTKRGLSRYSFRPTPLRNSRPTRVGNWIFIDNQARSPR